MTLDEQIAKWQQTANPARRSAFIDALIARDKARGEVVEAAQLVALGDGDASWIKLDAALARLAEMEQA